ncbi:ABC transporter permease [Phaeocystidibacter marisrubri]|uniref:ABC transporter permease n=1 Tax=Phaeocystidibacter marisrubri TaxID=1577780 RepID=A0A6L3ZGY6_9FLAO|nr:ABC transporter permease [Phaeocystidibacter marisrubri]KAB2817286.1 ABC transporter permease [Phaeocystidibacter marisrubri]GGH76097.1 ABC transporter permease [Phaeocystidibacter marisrubri]
MRRLQILENIRIAIDALMTQKLRAILTASVIAIGIMAMMGMLTSVRSLEQAVTDNFSSLGANTFTIQSRGMNIQIGRRGSRPKTHPPITWDQANDFVNRFQYNGATSSLSYRVTGAMEVKHGSKATDPNVLVWAIDENYLQTSGYSINEGRGFTRQDISDSRPIVLLGKDVYEKLFGTDEAIDTSISMRGQRYRVVGILNPKGSSSIFSGDNAVLIPITRARASLTSPSSGYSINVMTGNGANLDATVSEATAVMRAIRKQHPREESSFNITRSDALSSMLLENKNQLYIAAIAVSLITLLVAAINLLNIMLVSVRQRTREIGTRKAIGAKQRHIVLQFLTEAALVSQLGGVMGIIFGIIIGNSVGSQLGTTFTVPWDWVIFAVSITFVTGVLSGLYPAVKAARLDPIESLRYE